MPDQQKSRLDREIDEILAKKSKDPIEFKSHPRVKQQRGPSDTQQWIAKLASGWHGLQQMPLVLAYALVIVASLVNDFSPLLALVMCAAGVATLWLPGILLLVRPSTSTQTEVKYWRGQAYTQQIKSAVSRHPLDSLKRYFDRNR